MSTTTRRNTAAAAATADAATPPRTGARHYVHGSGAVTKSQRADLREAMRAGRTARTRTAAAEHVATVDALRAAGVDLPADPYVMAPEWTDAEGERLDARAVLADAEAAAAHTGRNVGRYSPRDARRMGHRDAANLARYASRCMARMSRPAMSESEQEEAECSAMLALLERGHGTFPRWDAILPDDDAAAAGYDQDAARSRWRGWAYVTGRAMSRTRHERLSAEQAADWTDPGEDAPTPEQRAAMLAEQAAAENAAALENVDPSTVDALAATAPGKPLSSAERDALWIGLAGITRAQLAAARSVDAETVKKGAQRGRKSLAARVPDAAAARQWARDAARADRDGWDLALAHSRTLPDAMRADAPIYRGVRLAWPDRIGTVADGAFILPPAPTGKGMSARDCVPHAWHPWKALPRLTRSGAPVLPAHRLLATLARASRTLARLDVAPTSTLDTAEAVTIERAPRPAMHPAKIGGKEADRMRVDAARAAERAARWIFAEQRP